VQDLSKARRWDLTVSKKGMMEISKPSIIAAGLYLLLLVLSITYELSIRIYDRGNSEFAGMLSTALTLPTSVPLIWLANSAFGIKPGHSNVSFVSILGFAALANACLIYAVAFLLHKLIRR
jgi:hypothetical protein